MLEKLFFKTIGLIALLLAIVAAIGSYNYWGEANAAQKISLACMPVTFFLLSLIFLKD